MFTSHSCLNEYWLQYVHTHFIPLDRWLLLLG